MYLGLLFLSQTKPWTNIYMYVELVQGGGCL